MEEGEGAEERLSGNDGHDRLLRDFVPNWFFDGRQEASHEM